MRTPEENYRMNPEYHQLVDYMENFLRQHQYTPSEMREAVMLACVNFEMKRVRPHIYNIEDLGNLPPEAFR